MKSLLPSLLALPLLLGACSTAYTTARAPGPWSHPTPPAVRLADANTYFGERPSYDLKGQYFDRVSWPNQRVFALDGTATLDLLIDRDGLVQKAAVVVSSGNAAIDQSATNMYWHALYSLKLGPADAAPHVVRMTVDFRRFASANKSSRGGINYNDGINTGYAPSTANDWVWVNR